MPRETQRRKTQREEVDLNSLSSPQLQQNRRFFRAGGSDKNVRTARAIEKAFGIGAEFVAEEQFRRNAEGQRKAVLEAGSGQTRDEQNEQAGYNRAWDQLDAEYDYNLVKKELPELLRGFDAENKTEGELQGFLTEYFQSQFGGIENLEDSAYAESLAPRLLELETEVIANHRDTQIAKVREEQRTKIFSNARDRFAETGEVPYEQIFKDTGTFFEGADKKTINWETLYDLAIEAGDSSVITNTPAMINGIPSGIDDPKLQDSHRAAVAAADSAGAKQQAAAEAAVKKQNEQSLFDTQLLIANKVFAGKPVNDEIAVLRSNPEASFSDITSAMNFGQAQLDESDSRSADLGSTSRLWQGIYTAEVSIADVMQAYQNGALGSGPQAVSTMENMMETAKQIRDSASRGNSSSLGAFRTEITGRYNPATQGMFAPLSPAMLHIRTEAVAAYNQKTLVEGMDPARAAMEVKEQFDSLVTDQVSEAQSQSEFARSAGVITVEQTKKFAAGTIGIQEFASGQTQQSIEGRLNDMIENDDISIAEAEQVIEQLF